MASVAPRPRPTVRSALARMLRIACPACGRGPLYDSYFVRAERCSHCRWKYEREDGFWVGGSEVHMFASYGVSVVVFLPLVMIAGTSPGIIATVILGHVALSLVVFRYSRSIFVGLDYLLDPERAPRDDDDRRESCEPGRPRPPSRGASRHRRRLRSERQRA